MRADSDFLRMTLDLHRKEKTGVKIIIEIFSDTICMYWNVLFDYTCDNADS